MDPFYQMVLAVLLALAIWDWWLRKRGRKEIRKNIKWWKETVHVEAMLARAAHHGFKPSMFRWFALQCENAMLPKGFHTWPLESIYWQKVVERESKEELKETLRKMYESLEGLAGMKRGEVSKLLNVKILDLYDYQDWLRFPSQPPYLDAQVRQLKKLQSLLSEGLLPDWLDSLAEETAWVNCGAYEHIKKGCEHALDAVRESLLLFVCDDFASDKIGGYRRNSESWAAAQNARYVARHWRDAVYCFAHGILLAHKAKLYVLEQDVVEKFARSYKAIFQKVEWNPINRWWIEECLKVEVCKSQADWLRGFCPWADTPIEETFPDGDIRKFLY